MPLARRFTAVAPAVLLVAAAAFALFSSVTGARAAGSAGGCGSAGVTVLPSPIAPWTGAPLRVLVVADKPIDGELSLLAPDGSVAAKSDEREGGPPYFWYAAVAAPAAGTWRVKLDRTAAGCAAIMREVAVRADRPAPPRANSGSLWPLHNTWNRETEDLFSAWIEKLFDAPLDQELSWKSWDLVLRDRSRNFLFNYLGLGEDRLLGGIRPDCADFVYFLRAYFAFKMGLPFGYSNCSRGVNGRPPRCYQWFDVTHPQLTRPPPPPPSEQTAASPAPEPLSNSHPPQRGTTPPASAAALGLAQAFRHYLPVVADVVQTGAVRVLATDNRTDFYMVPLTQGALRPGTVYADPYGHVLMLAKRVAESNGAPGVFLAVDAEPDGTVTRKRFWRGNFLFVQDPARGNAGFKRFRPVVRDRHGLLRRLTNAEIAKDPQYGDFSLEQTRLDAQQFYDRMDDVMSPQPVDPAKAMESAVADLYEQVQTRVTSVENGRKYLEKAPGVIAMPSGPAIFETTGAWEDYSTPARDFRLLIAIDVVSGFPDHVARRIDRYVLPPGGSAAQVKVELQSALAAELAAHKLAYTRSDGSQWTLTLKDILDRATDLEMGYNPNDCVELRWGAPPNSQEASTCKRHAPAAQRAKMLKYRAWFVKRRWPTQDQSAMAKKPRQEL